VTENVFCTMILALTPKSWPLPRDEENGGNDACMAIKRSKIATDSKIRRVTGSKGLSLPFS